MVGRRDLLRHGAGAIAAAGLGSELVRQTSAAPLADGLGSGDPKHIALLVLDRSGSMHHLRESVVREVNAYLDDQRNKAGLHIGLVQFDSEKTASGGHCQPTFAFTPATQCPRLELKDYQPRGGTPLLAAVTEAIAKLEQVVRPIDRALLVVQTDGLENASPAEITKDVVRDLITAKEQAGNWTFVFMGASIDAWGEGGSLGFVASNTQGYTNTATGTAAAYAATSTGTSNWYVNTGGGLTGEALLASPTSTQNFYTGTSAIDTKSFTITANQPLAKPPQAKKRKDRPSQPA